MRVAYMTAGDVGAGHLVRGVAIGRGLARAGFAGTYRMFGPPLGFPAGRRNDYEAIGIRADGALRDPHLAQGSDLAVRLADFAPDLLLVDMFWGPLRWVLPRLACEAWLLVRICPPVWLEGGPGLPFEPAQYRRRFAIEPIRHPRLAETLDPIVVANPEECRGREEVRRRWGVASGEPLALVQHAGERGEIEELRRLAGPEARTLDLFEPEALFPAAEWLPGADRVYSGAGYNSYWEARWLGYERRTTFLPFRRSIDDQARRLKEFRDVRPRENGADALAREVLAGG